MAKKKKKKKVSLNTAQMKQFFIDHGERVALAVAAVIAVWLLIGGAMAMVFSTPFWPNFEKMATIVRGSIQTNHPTGPDAVVGKVSAPRWEFLTDLEPLATSPWFDPGSAGASKLALPPLLRIPEYVRLEKKKDRVSNFQIDFVQGAFFRYDADTRRTKLAVLVQGKPTESALQSAPPAQYVQSGQIVVVSMTFPYKQQLDLIRKALRLPNIPALLSHKEFKPRWLGLEVVRYELDKHGRQIPESMTYLYKADKDKKTVVEKRIERLFTLAVLDGDNYRSLYPHLQHGLATPVPRLAFGKYPEIKLPGIKQKKVASSANFFNPSGGTTGGEFPGGSPPGSGEFPGSNPAGGGFPGGTNPNQQGSGAAIKLVDLSKWKKDPLVAKRVRGEYNPFDPLGRLAEDLKKTTGMGGNPDFPTGNPGSGGGIKPPGSGTGSSPQPPGESGDGTTPQFPAGTSGEVPEKVLLRFIDPTIEPNKRYVYWVRLRMANPIYGKENVMYKSQAEQEEIFSMGEQRGWTRSPIVETPATTAVYVVDQRELESRSSSVSSDKTRTYVQVHRWIDKFKAGGLAYESGVWAILPRLEIRRGEYLGLPDVQMPMPKWNETLGRFQPAEDPSIKRRKNKLNLPEVRVDFFAGGRVPIAVDYEGGRDWYSSYGRETSSLEMLMLAPDGKLLLHSSRVDMDSRDPESRGAIRAERYRQWVQSLLELAGKGKNQSGGGTTPPGGFPGSGGSPGAGGG